MHSAARLEAAYRKARAGMGVSYTLLDSIEGLDRHQNEYTSPTGIHHDALTRDQDLTDQRLKLRVYSEAPLPIRAVTVGVSLDYQRRNGTADELERTANDVRLGRARDLRDVMARAGRRGLTSPRRGRSMARMSMVLFVTGATAGFGAAIARRFVAQGARVVAVGRRGDRLEELRSELGDHLLPVVLDVRDRVAIEQAVAALPPEFTAIDVLVNNAGGALGLEPAQKADLDDWEAMIDTNVKGLAYCTRRCCPAWSRATAGTSSTSDRSPASFPTRAATSTAPARPSSISSA